MKWQLASTVDTTVSNNSNTLWMLHQVQLSVLTVVFLSIMYIKFDNESLSDVCSVASTVYFT